MKKFIKVFIVVLVIVCSFCIFSADIINCNKNTDKCIVIPKTYILGDPVRTFKLTSIATVSCKSDMDFYNKYNSFLSDFHFLSRNIMYISEFATVDTKNIRALRYDLFSISDRYCNYLANELEYFLYNDDLRQMTLSNFTLHYWIRDFFRFIFHYKVEL